MKNIKFLVIISTLCLVILWVIMAMAGCGPRIVSPPPPPFIFDINLPTDTNSALELTIQPGTAATLPVTLKSNKNQDIEVILMVDLDKNSPEGILIDFPKDVVRLPAGENVTFQIVYAIGENVAPGRYRTMLSGTSMKPVEGIARDIDIIVTEKP